MNFLLFLIVRIFKIPCSAELTMKKSFITSGPEMWFPSDSHGLSLDGALLYA